MRSDLQPATYRQLNLEEFTKREINNLLVCFESLFWLRGSFFLEKFETEEKKGRKSMIGGFKVSHTC